MRRKLLLVGVSLVFSALLAEGLVRLVWHNPFSAEESELLVHVATQPPNAQRKYMGPYAKGPPVVFRTDARGYIVPARRGVAGAKTVVFFGGSTTECSGLGEAARFPALVGTILAARGVPVDTLNTGRSGNTTHETLNIFLNHALADRPDVAVMMHAVNDTGILAQNGDYSHAMAHRDGLRWGLKAIARALAGKVALVGLVRFIRLGGVRHVGKQRVYAETRQKAPDLPFRQRLVAFVRLAGSFGITPVLLTQPMAYVRDKRTPTWAEPAKQAVFNDLIRAVGREEQAAVIDLAAHLRGIDGWDTPDRFFYDGLHLNEAGSKVVAEVIANGLQPLIAERLERDVALPAAASAAVD